MRAHVARGFVVVYQKPTLVLLQRKRQFEWGWAAVASLGVVGAFVCVGFLVCVFPLLAYFVYYALQPAVEVVELTIAESAG